jgi:hypothetical protein
MGIYTILTEIRNEWVRLRDHPYLNAEMNQPDVIILQAVRDSLKNLADKYAILTPKQKEALSEEEKFVEKVLADPNKKAILDKMVD